MRINSYATDRKTRKLLVIAQLMTLMFSALGLAFAWHPTPVNLFLFAALSPGLVSGAVVIVASQWFAAFQRGQARRLVAHGARRGHIERLIRQPLAG